MTRGITDTRQKCRAHLTRAPLLVAIVGGSGAGKSWLAQRLQRALRGRAARLSLDDFYLDRSHLSLARREKLNFDRPASIDWPCFEKALQRLAKGKSAAIPCYDFTTHARLARNREVQAKPILLVEGLWLLKSPACRNLFALRIFIDTPKNTRLIRRLARDLKSRGRTRSSVLRQLRTTVEPMFLKHVAPQKRWANLVMAGCNRVDVRKLASLLLASQKTNPRRSTREYRLEPAFIKSKRHTSPAS